MKNQTPANFRMNPFLNYSTMVNVSMGDPSNLAPNLQIYLKRSLERLILRPAALRTSIAEIVMVHYEFATTAALQTASFVSVTNRKILLVKLAEFCNRI